MLFTNFFNKKIKKQIQGICINISLAAIVPYLLLILLIIQLHQRRYYQQLYGDDYYKYDPVFIFQYFGDSLNYLLLTAGFLFVLLYTIIIKKWKALPEG